jgi:hypothetical protein
MATTKRTSTTRSSPKLELPAPIPRDVTMPLVAADNPDGSHPAEPSVLEGLLPELVSTFHLDQRLFTQHGRLWLAGRLLAVEEIEAVLRGVGERHELGLHLSCIGKHPGLGSWLRWEGLSQIKHLSFDGAFLRAQGVELLLATGRLAAVETLDLSVCDVALKGLRLLNATDAMPRLSELYLGANPDYDKTHYDEKAVAALLADTKAKPMGGSLRHLRVLGLMFWELVKAMPTLEASPVIQQLQRLWISDTYYRDYANHSNVEVMPPSLRSRCVVGWEQRSLA